MKELFPLNTFQQDAVLKRLNDLLENDKELDDSVKDIVDGSEHLFENITDAQGHKRFVDYEPKSLYELEGLTFSYVKASLSGNHLLIVCCGTFANTTITPINVDLATFEFPEWLNDKIVGVWGDFIEAKSVNMYNADWTTQTQAVSLRKKSYGIGIYTVGTTTLTKDRNFRFTFDLLIDGEEPVNP